MRTDTQKLRVLRARTDHDLLALAQREIDRGVAAAGLATTKCSHLYAQAKKSYETAGVLLSRVAAADRLRMEGRVADLRKRLDDVPAFASAASLPASFAS